MIYTSYDMVRDCRADRPEGWTHLISHYVPVIRKLVAHYFPEHAGKNEPVEQVLRAARSPKSGLFDSMDAVPERQFLAELRQFVLRALQTYGGQPARDLEPDLETITAAFEPLTPVEKQAVWLDTMQYDAAAAAVLLRMDPNTIEKIRGRAGELLRAKVDTWNRGLLREYGAALGRAAAASKTESCFPAKTFLDMLDGRTTWSGREQAERHLTTCWHCVDHFCRLAEVLDLLRGLQPLAQPEAERFSRTLGLPTAKKPAWKRLFAGS